ncbi:Deoxyribodipyrimidine photo-lyase [Corynebacterium capitovis DSM 44611]|uniref:cryptochrome/photolyase family protein n=1 Tax=Corynebacterium capitovis TaxID=131081 RepID=UPI000369E5AC|nr:deoxyribodipyrimidine photo-lyase [Corynebacterium capitovis]WKD57953.1 Deoxyribodipyrimidine photo-lyase [Corynebacterium capitovis DSM 44611]
MPSPPTIVWFRDDLRLADNRALHWAAERGPVVGLFIHETVGRPLGSAAAWWQRKSLNELRKRLSAPLIERRGDPRDIVPQLARELGAAVTWNRRYHLSDIDAGITHATGATTHPGYLLTEPWHVRTQGGSPYKVFSPFYRAALALLLDAPPSPLPMPEVTPADVEPEALPAVAEPEWVGTLGRHNQPGELGGVEKLHAFDVTHYDNNDLGAAGTSGLSPHLRFGEISPATVWSEVSGAAEEAGAFLRQLLWRDFAWHRFFHVPNMATVNVRGTFERFPWEWTPRAEPSSTPRAFAHAEMDPGAQHLEELAAWQSGRTGVPLVDAGMRELWATGRMHNRARMVTGSWLTKNLGIHWRHGEEWFWDTLVDADAASNAFNWQWVAGSGDDAAPYFRVFNPLTQQKKYDADGSYVARWVPETATPFYPEPMVNITESRNTALAAYGDIKD